MGKKVSRKRKRLSLGARKLAKVLRDYTQRALAVELSTRSRTFYQPYFALYTSGRKPGPGLRETFKRLGIKPADWDAL